MPRATNVPATRRRRKKWLKLAKGFWGGRRRLYRQARETVMRGQVFAFRDRKARKRSFRSLWVVRINAACRPHGISYSRLIAGLKRAGVSLDRKLIADLCIADPTSFERLVEIVKQSSSPAKVKEPR